MVDGIRLSRLRGEKVHVSPNPAGEQVKIAEVRARIYELLAQGYLQEPNSEYVEALARVVNLMKDNLIILGDFTILSSKDIGEIKQEYYNRFFVPVSGIYVPPFESAIVDRELNGKQVLYGPLNGPLTVHVMDCYKLVQFDPWNLKLFKPLREIPIADYLGFELAFMAYLSFAELEAYKSNLPLKGLQWRRLQKSFLELHPKRWIGDYAFLANQAAKGFFGEIAKITSAWVEADYHYLQAEQEGLAN